MTTLKLVALLEQDLGYCAPSLKNAFHREARSVLLKVSKAMDLIKTDFKISSNKSGIAGSGSVALKTSGLYINIEQRSSGLTVLYRSTQGNSGGRNNYTPAISLLEDAVIGKFLAIHNSHCLDA
jgi:hypothetical protein